jgi:hypothetical protein
MLQTKGEFDESYKYVVKIIVLQLIVGRNTHFANQLIDLPRELALEKQAFFQVLVLLRSIGFFPPPARCQSQHFDVMKVEKDFESLF